MTLSFQNITHSYSGNAVLRGLNLDAKAGEITCLFGVSGSGKSTLLRLAAGLENLQQGAITLNGELLAKPTMQPPPEKRPIGLMFQENALFPHMTIAENIAFGLDRINNGARGAIINHWLQAIGLDQFGPRYPHTLSGGQVQRVALARSLAPKPLVLLMDEPFASIDNILRRQLRETTRRTLKEHGTTAIFVTHDPVEAMAMADHIAVLDNGTIAQIAVPQELYDKPANAKIAQLFGEAQVFDALVAHGGFQTPYGFIHAAVAPALSDQPCSIAARPQGLVVSPNADSALIIADIRFAGGHWLLYLLPDNAPPSLPPLVVAEKHVATLLPGTKVELSAGMHDWFCFYQ